MSGRPLDARARLLHLQRTAGNRAVGRLLAQRHVSRQQAQSPGPNGSSGARPPIQRKVGFEVELSVPTFGQGTLPLNLPRDPNGWISALLTGGLTYNVAFGNLKSGADNIKLKPDHNRLNKLGETLYKELQIELPTAGFTDTGYVAVSNLEYDTDALDEMAPGSNARFQAMATAIDDHTAQIMSKGPKTKGSAIPNSAPTKWTGIPVDQIQLSIGPEPAWDDVTRALKAFQDAVGWFMYPQATVGIMPSGLGSLFLKQHQKAESGDAPAKGSSRDAKNTALQAVVTGMSNLEKDDDMVREIRAWFKSPDNVGGAATSVDRYAVQGGLALSLSYAIGNALNATSLLTATEKNAAPFLIKTSTVARFATHAATTWLRNNPPEPNLIDTIANWFHDNVEQTSIDYWTRAPYNAVLAPGRQRLYGGTRTAVNATRALMTRILTGAGGVDALGSGNPLPSTDPVSPEISSSPEIRGQTGLPLEYRWLPQRPTAAGELWSQVFKPVLDEVRDVNLSHLPQETREDIDWLW